MLRHIRRCGSVRTTCYSLSMRGVLLLIFLACSAASAQTQRVAITIDDLPRGGDGGPTTLAEIRNMTQKLLKPFREQKIPVIGFVNEGRQQLGPEGLRTILDVWLDAGADLGNHAYSHPDINNVPLETYTADVLKGEPITRAALSSRGKKLEFFRHPYLHTGPTADLKKGLQAFLDKSGYRVAPVTIDDADYEFAALYTHPEFRDRVKKEYVPYMESVVAFFERRAVEVTGHEIPQILLIHASQMNADQMPDLLAMFKRRGYTFVTLSEALADPAYSLPEDYTGRNGFSWIHRWSQTKGMPNKGEPDPPTWVEKAYSELRN
jgi:peptidoglycan/xylan/chitin deacetylase (PgdA/CDA1 family)